MMKGILEDVHFPYHKDKEENKKQMNYTVMLLLGLYETLYFKGHTGIDYTNVTPLSRKILKKVFQKSRNPIGEGASSNEL